MADFLETILEPKQQRDPHATSGAWLVVGIRAKNSAELEQREAEYLKTDLLPIPFYSASGELEPLTKQDKAQLKSHGITVEEYETLVGKEIP